VISVCIVDTSVLCEFLCVPNLSCEADQLSCKREMQDKIKSGEQLVLPMATILETGNHIGQNGDGGQRWKCASRFVAIVRDAINGNGPFAPVQFAYPEGLIKWIGEFTDWAGHNDARGKGSGLGDHSIYQDWMRLRELHPHRRVYIWSRDLQLSSYDTGAGE